MAQNPARKEDNADLPAEGAEESSGSQVAIRSAGKKGLITAARFGKALDLFSDIVLKADDEGKRLGSIAPGPIRFGLIVILIIFGFFGLWSAMAPLDSAAVARGVVVPDSNRKTVQHLEGGIIDEIYVKSGDEVKEGDKLLRLSETAAKARMDLLNGQYFAARASEARLIAERDGMDAVKYPEDILKEAETKQQVKDIVESQSRLFDARRQSLEGQINVLKQKIAQSKEEIEGLAAQERSARNQIALLNEEIATVDKLLKQGNAMKPRLLALQRNAAELEGRRGEYLALSSRAQQTITEAELEIINQQTEFLNKVVTELRDTQIQISDLEEKRRASADILDRIVIVAPQSGIVTDLQYHTRGGVIAPGAKIMDIVPQDDKKIIEAHVNPTDIDVVHKGLKARVRLSAYKARRMPPLDGEVINVSPDRFVDDKTREAYYIARVEVDAEELEKLDDDVNLQPGMPAEVLIVTGSRTMLQYLFQPFLDSMHRAFREQ